MMRVDETNDFYVLPIVSKKGERGILDLFELNIKMKSALKVYKK